MHPTRIRDTLMEERPNNHFEDKQDISGPSYSQGVAMKKCPSCNANIEADSVYCEYCGSKVSDFRPSPTANTSTSNYSNPNPSANIGNRPERPNNYLGLAIACIIFCWPLGIPSVVNAAKVNRLWDEGKYEEAQEASDTARSRGTTGLIIGIVINVLYFILVMVGAIGDF